jgi:hypothetical protein
MTKWIISWNAGYAELWLVKYDERGLVFPVDGPYRVKVS